MSHNQSRFDKSEGQPRRPGRSTNRGFYGGGGGGRGGAAPPLSNPQANRSFRNSGNGQGGQQPVTHSTGASAAPNGGHVLVPPRGPPEPAPGGSAGRVEASVQKAPGVVPKAPSSSSSSQPAAGASESAATSTPQKGDPSKTFNLQFGSISPGLMNGMQIPARTSSAPPNLDEQKQAQARHDSFKAMRTMPIPSAPKQQQQPRKDVGSHNKSNTGEFHPPTQAKRDMHVPISSAHTSVPPKQSVLPIGGMPVHMPFPQPQISMQFSGPSPQMQSQGVTANSLQMTMAMMNGPQVQQQMFVPNFHPHPMQPQALMHQGPSMGFAPQMGHQLPSQLGNIGFGISPQFTQQPGNFGGPRKTTVKITHPDTHEELRLDKRTDSHVDGGASSQRPLSNVTTESQSIQAFDTSHQISYYQPSGSYSPFFSAPNSHPLTSTQMTTGFQGQRFSYPVAQNGQTISFLRPPPTLHGVSEGPNLEVPPVPATSAPVQVTIKPAVSSSVQRTGAPSVIISMPRSNVDAPKLLKPQGHANVSHQNKEDETVPRSVRDDSKSAGPQGNASLLVTDSTEATSGIPTERIQIGTSITVTSVVDSSPIESATEGSRQECIQRSDSLKDHPKKTAKKDASHTQQQNQATAPTAAGFTKSSKLIEDGSNVSAQELPRGSETFHSLSGSDSPTTAAKLPCTNEEHASSVEPLESESFEVKEIPALAVSEVTLVKEAPQGERFVSGISDSTSVNEQISVDSVLKDENLIATEDETVEAPTDFSHDSTISISSPVSTMIGTSEAVNSVKSIKQEDVRGKNSEKVNICEVFDEKEQIETKNEEVDCMLNADGKSEESDVPSVASSDIKDAVTIKYDTNSSLDIALSDPVTSPVESTPVLATVLSETKQNLEDQVAQLSSGLAGTVILSGQKDKITSEPARARTTAAKKKKRKELFSKADAAGTSDLYNAYKGPEEKNEVADSLENVDSSLTVNTTDVQADVHGKNAVAGEEDEQSKTEIDDWEDAADISTPKLGSEGDLVLGNEATNMKRYSRDFLLTFIEQCTDLPVGFEMGSDIADALMSSPVVTTHFFERDSYPSPGRITDRSLGASRMDRRMAGVSEDERWTKASSFGPGRDIRLDMGYGAANVSSRVGQGINHGVLRNPRGQSNHFAGGILSGPVQSMPSQGGMPRSNSDADRWQRAPGVQRGLIPSPHATSQIMHKATNKYEVGKVSDKEEAKQRQLKAILNKLTPQNFEKLFLQVKEVNIDNTVTLTGVISQIFDKALTEPTFCEMYANFCAHLSNELPDFNEDNERITFKRLLLNKCQEEFERGEREEAEANKAEEDGEIKQTEAEREEKRTQARRRMLGNIRLIGELYKKRMLTERIMHECIKKLLGEYENPDEEDLEALCKLMSTIGEMIDYPKAKVHMDGYFVRMLKLSTNQKLSSRVRFLLRDAIDLRKNKWQQRRKIEGPKKIDEVHRDAAQERQAQASRLSRGPVISSASRRGPPVDYSSRSNSVIPSLSSQQINSNRGMPAQVRGHATQDVRMDERQQFESRVLSVPLPQRSTDDTITLGPQGGLARGMSIRGQPLMSNAPSADVPTNLGDPRRLASGSNSYNFMSREDNVPRYTQDKFSSAQYDQPSPYGRSSSIGSRDPQFPDNVTDKSAVTTITGRINASSGILPAPSETKQLSQESLREKSISAIQEFYSAKDEEEVILCIKELNSPSFYPSMVSLWVTDSFERKDKERDLLAKLLVNLCKSRDNLLRQNQLIQGFVSVLSTLEDAVNDAPRAAEFLGHIFAKVTLEQVVPLTDIARLIREGGEEPGSLVETGLAAEVLASILQFIRTEKGDSVLSEIRTSSGLRLEDFRPPHSTRSNKLDPFIGSADDTITLGPQVGLARGMSIRGQPLMSNAPSADIPPNLGDSRRLASGSNSYNFMSREDFMPRYTQDKFSSAQYDQPSPYGRSSSIGSRDPRFPDNVTDKSAVTTIPGRKHASSGFLPAPSETKQLSQESLREKSISAIREFYSAKDEEEVILCIKELKSPSFYPSMVSLWVTDSFERKDKERDLLAKLLVNLCKSRDNLLRQNQLIQGFVSVLSALEDAVIDAPRAAEFLGHIFAKVTLEHIVPLTEIARLIREGGEEPGSLVETGLASEVLASILQFIRTEKGDSVLSEIRTSSGLRLEDFRPPHSTRSNKLDPFL